jgi:ribosomal protein L13
MEEQTRYTHKHFSDKFSEETRQHFKSAREEFHKSMEGMLPPGFVEHRRKAHKELLLAWRSMIDASLERMEPTKKKDK